MKREREKERERERERERDVLIVDHNHDVHQRTHNKCNEPSVDEMFRVSFRSKIAERNDVVETFRDDLKEDRKDVQIE